MKNPPLISVIIPVYNGERYLAAALESVLAQNDPRCEIIVVDDGSTDRTSTIAQSFPVHYCAQPNSGAATARNHGLALAQGEFFAFLDADDLWLVDKLTRQLSAFACEPELEAVFGQVEQFYSPEVYANNAPAAKVIAAPYHGSMLIRRAAFFRVGWFATNCQLGEVVEWFLRAQESHLKSLMLPEIVYRRRIHQTNQGFTKRQQQQEYVHLLKAALDRRRQLLAVKA